MAQQQPPQQFIVQSPASNQPQSRSHGYNQTGGKVTGAIQLVCGVATITFGVLSFPGILPIEDHIDGGSLFLGLVFTVFGVAFLPMIAGVFFIVSGSLGTASKKGNGCLIGTYMAFSIISIVFAIPPLIFDSILAIAYKCRDNGYDDEDCPQIEIFYGMHVALVISIVVEIIVALAGSIICCQGVCCSSSTSNASSTTVQTVQYVQSQPQPNVQLQTTSSYPPLDQPPPYNPNAPPENYQKHY
ncbi:uncharacterized protein [Amphiura filiformis]|uniref:uncharacterized protein isoform X2 n=1 Tax=Amphiura filiformis TaxID=82378 RepID=UPI003B21DF49